MDVLLQLRFSLLRFPRLLNLNSVTAFKYTIDSRNSALRQRGIFPSVLVGILLFLPAGSSVQAACRRVLAQMHVAAVDTSVLPTHNVDTAQSNRIPNDSLRTSRTDTLSAAQTDSLNRQAGNNKSDAPTSVPASTGLNRAELPGFFDPVLNIPRDWADYCTSFVDEDHLPLMSLIASSTVLLTLTDYQTWQPFKKWYHSSPAVEKINDGFVFLGDGKFLFSAAGAFLAYGVVANDKRALRTASQSIEVVLACGGVVQILKHLTGRESPIVSTVPTGIWKLFPNQIEYANHVPHYDAFPSGHLSTALGLLIVIANNYPEQKWIRPLGYVACAGISVGLVTTSIHWWSDYPLAIALGYGFGTLLSPKEGHADDLETSKKPSPTGHDHSDLEAPTTLSKLTSSAVFYPQLTPDGGGIGVAFRF